MVVEERGMEDSTLGTLETASGPRPLELVLRGVLPNDTLCIPLDRPRLVLGRGAGCDVVIPHARVSRQHLELRRDGPIIVARDLESSNGSHVDGQPATQFVLKPASWLRLGDWLGRVVQQPRGEAQQAFGEIAPTVFGGGELRRVVDAIRSAGQLPLALSGPTGTGKECFARIAHAHSGRSGPFHALNCAALSGTLAEAELFGFEKGAFTGAERTHLGHLRAASGGTLFLDEAQELPPVLQAKLLRAIELGEVSPLGSTQMKRFDARIVVASNAPLAALVAEGMFRRDLAARLSGFSLSLPTLAERAADIPALFRLFVDGAGGRAIRISTRLYEALCLHSWPANVRELKLLALQLVARHGDAGELRRSHLPAELLESRAQRHRSPSELERLSSALEKSGGNVTRAAELAGMSRQRVYRLMRGRSPTELLANHARSTGVEDTSEPQG